MANLYERDHGTRSAAVMFGLIMLAMLAVPTVSIIRDKPATLVPILAVLTCQLLAPLLLGYVSWNYWPAFKRYRSFMPLELQRALKNAYFSFVMFGVSGVWATFDLVRSCQ